jgi:hypothetical protein
MQISGKVEPPLLLMPAMQRRRMGPLGKMALEVAYRCLDGRTDVPTVFCSRHGEVARSVGLLEDLASGELLSPTSFGLSVHNAIGGFFSIARGDGAGHAALSARENSVEHAVIEACALLADGAPAVLLVAYEFPLPTIYEAYQDENMRPFAWAWLIEPAQERAISLSWHASNETGETGEQDMPAGLQILRFYLGEEPCMKRSAGNLSWEWSRNA